MTKNLPKYLFLLPFIRWVCKFRALMAALFLLIGVFSQAQPITQPIEYFDNDMLKLHVQILSSDLLQGRAPGTKGDSLSTLYLLEEFASIGLQTQHPFGQQEFMFRAYNLVGEGSYARVSDSRLELHNHFLPAAFSATAKAEAPIVICPYGTKNDRGLFDKSELKEKWVMLIPNSTKQKTSNISTPAAHRDLVFEMLDRGASGVIFVCDFFEPDTITSLQTALPVLYVTRDAAQYILNNYVEAAANNKKIPDVSNDTICVITDIVFEAACKIEPVFRNTGNIMGAIINNRSNRYLIIGAHYDHLGLGGYGSSSRRPEEPAIHYGADDNASGVAGMLLLASAISKSELCDSLNFIFIAFGAEERGLLGSKFVVENMPVPIDSVVAMINLDMIGRLQSDKKIVAGGTGTAADMEKLLNDAVLHSNLVVHHQSEGYGPSDHAAFYAAGIPVMYFSTGAHPDYHTPDDSEQKINYPGMQQVLEYVYGVVRLIASNNYQMHFTEAGPRQASETRHGRGKVSFGIMPDITATDIQGLRVQAVSPGKPAYLAGMKSGDIIVAIGGMPVSDIYEYMFRLSRIEPGATITVDIIRNSNNMVLLIQL